jgi:hypothetical protein
MLRCLCAPITDNLTPTHSRKVGAGVTVLSEGDWVMPFKSNLGTWRSLATCKERDLMKIPADLMPMVGSKRRTPVVHMHNPADPTSIASYVVEAAPGFSYFNPCV